jgi:Protein of unknown function (DUF3987)
MSAEAAKAAQKKWKEEVEEAIKSGKEPPPRPPAAAGVAKFVRPRLYITDTTVERAAVLLQARPSGLVLIRDELSGLFANMSRYSNGSDREFWLESWNGKHYVVERMGRDAVVVDHLLIAVVGGFQPEKPQAQVNARQAFLSRASLPHPPTHRLDAAVEPTCVGKFPYIQTHLRDMDAPRRH